MRALILTVALVFAAASTAKAESFAKVSDPTVVKECGTDCHMPFPPETLPQASWRKIIGDLSNHFGEDASLDQPTVDVIMDYHLKNSNDVLNSRAANKWRASGAPARIQDAPRFKNKHTKCDAATFAEVAANPKVKAWSNCLACHPDMVRTGDAEDNTRGLGLTRAQTRCFDD